MTQQSQSDTKSYIKASNISYWYGRGDEIALADTSFTIQESEFVCILGPSGCGKSTLLSILSGLTPPPKGTISIQDRDLYHVKHHEKRPRCGYVFQDGRLLPWRTVKQNITIALQAAEIEEGEWDERVSSSLKMLDLDPYSQAWPMQLSGGQRQRVAIARALAVDPSYILMDEPFSTLDEVTARFLRGELLSIWERTGRTIVFVTHSLREAVYLADRILIMTKGPGRILKELPIEVSRPRDYEDPKLTEIERDLAQSVLEMWGFHERNI